MPSRREEGTSDNYVRGLGDYGLRVTGNLGYVLDQRGHVRVGDTLGRTSYSYEPFIRDQSQSYFVVANGGCDDPQWFGRDADDAVYPLDFTGPAEVGGI